MSNSSFPRPQDPQAAPKICMAQGMARSAAAKATQPGPANQALSRSREASEWSARMEKDWRVIDGNIMG